MTTTTTTTTEIAASASRVWEVLTDSVWWNQAPNGVVSLTGNIALGEKVKLVSELSPDRPFKLKVTEFEPESRMVWTGGAPLGLFTGNRFYEISETSDDQCRFTMYEDFSGPMSGMVIKKLPDFQESFDAFASALKASSQSA